MRMIYVVDIDSGDDEIDEDYLNALQDCFIKVTDLQAWGYTSDELLCRSAVGDRAINILKVALDKEPKA
jgi:hypothetical protein